MSCVGYARAGKTLSSLLNVVTCAAHGSGIRGLGFGIKRGLYHVPIRVVEFGVKEEDMLCHVRIRL